MKRYSLLLLLSVWLVLLFVISTITLHIDSLEEASSDQAGQDTSEELVVQLAD